MKNLNQKRQGVALAIGSSSMKSIYGNDMNLVKKVNDQNKKDSNVVRTKVQRKAH